MEKIIKLNEIFEENIKKLTGSIKMRNRKITLTDAIYYRFMYSREKTTKQSIVSNLNYFNETKAERSSYHRKENNIPVSLYKNIFEEIQKVFYDNFTEKNYFKCKQFNIPQLSSYKMIAVDGTYSNTNISADKGKLETSQTTGYFDISNGIPLDLTFDGKKNNEISSLSSYIEKNELKNIIFIADRGYFKYGLFDLIESKSLKYIIRIKNNSLVDKKVNKNNKNYNIINKINESSRVVTYSDTIKKNVTTRNNKKETIMINRKCKLLTNLTNKDLYSDALIAEIYKSRWDIEVFFKLVKNNYKFENVHEKNIKDYEKMYYCQLIITHIMKMITYAYFDLIKINKKKNTTTIRKKNKCGKKYKEKIVKCKRRVNNTNIICGIYEALLKDIIKSSLTVDNLINFSKCYVKINKNELDRSFDRIAKTPFKKWYVKGYHNIYKYTKIIDSVKNNINDALNKNLKLIKKEIKCMKES